MERGSRLGGALFEELFLQGDLDAWLLRELGALNSARRDFSSRSDGTLPVGVDSSGKKGDKITMIFIVISDSFLLVVTVLFY